MNFNKILQWLKNKIKTYTDYHFFKDKLNNFFGRYIGKEQRPTFFDIDVTVPELSRITSCCSIIKQEFTNVIGNKKNLPRYHDIDPGEYEISNTTDKNWNVFMLYLLGYHLAEAKTLCPQTYQMLMKIPNIIQAFFSILEPGKAIPKHEGPYLGYLRYHLGIHIPKQNPPKIIVNNQTYTWKDGEAILFDDSWPHEVHNNAEDFRAVLIVDVLRPMPLLPNIINKFITKIVGRYLYGKKTIQRAAKFNKSLEPYIK